MSHVIALVDRETGLGYRLAGVDVRETGTSGEMGRQAEAVSADPEVRLVILDEALFHGLPRATQRRLEESRSPVFVPVPSLPLRTEALRAEEYVARLMRRAVGYQVRIRR
jgi:vacuolar-type H+-ATPase subunit F/Vma7